MCKNAIEASGLTSGDFSAQIEVLAKERFAKYLIAKNTKEGGSAAAEACDRAMAASGLAGDAF